MEKIKFTLPEFKNEVVKINGQKVEIKKIISADDQLAIGAYCNKQYIAIGEDDRFVSYPIIKGIFDILVINYNTNIEVPHIASENSVDSSDIEAFSNSRVIDSIKSHILNYDETWELVSEGIRLINVFTSIGHISESLPSADEMKKSFEDMAEFIDNNQELVQDAVKHSKVVDALDEARKEIAPRAVKKTRTRKEK